MFSKFGLLVLIIVVILSLDSVKSYAQCSICTRTVQQMGEKPGKAFNAGIIYLALTPFAIIAIVGYRWWKQNS